MSATARKDVLLVIQAKETASKAIEAATDALARLFETQGDVGEGARVQGGKLLTLASAIRAVEGAYSKIDTASGKADSAFKRQQANLTETKTQLAAVKAQIEGVGKAIEAAQAGLVSAKLGQAPLDRFGGFKNAEDYVARIAAAKAALPSLVIQEDRLTASIRAQEAALGPATNSLQQLGSIANAARAALVGVDESTRRSISSFEDQKRACAAVGAAAREVGIAETAMAEKAANLRAQLNPLGAIQERLNRELKEAKNLYQAGKISAEELALAEKMLAQNAKNAADQLGRRGRGENGRVGLFGLKPYEMTNLGYQINDVFTQLGSGTSLTQTMAQQGGQLLQLFPKLGATIIAALGNPVVIGAAAAFGLLLATVKHLMNENARMRAFGGSLAAMGDGARYSAKALSDQALALDLIGMSANEAVASVRRFIREGFQADLIDDIGRAALNLSVVMGEDVKTAVDQVAAAFSSGFEAIARLDDATNFLTATERQQIRVMYESGQAAEARARAFMLFEQRMDKGAEKARGTWGKAAIGLERAWSGMLTALSSTGPVRDAIALVGGLTVALRELGEVSANGTHAEPVAIDIASLDKKIAETTSRIQRLKDYLRQQEHSEVGPEALQAMRSQIAAAEAALARLHAQKQASDRRLAEDPRDPRSKAAQMERLELARERARELKLVELQGRLEELIQTDRRWGVVRDEASRIAISGEIEYQRVLAQTSNKSKAAVAREIAEARERARIHAEQRQNEEQAITKFSRRVMARESSNNNNARPRNPDGSLASSALGQGQFLERTWLNLFRKYFPDQARKMGESAILELRRNQEVSRRLIELYARENAEVLRKAGVSVTQLNLYLAHYLGPKGAANLLRAAPNTPIRQALSGGAAAGSRADRQAGAAIAHNSELRRGGTAAGVIAAVKKRWGGEENGPADEAEQAVLEQINQLEAQRLAQQEALNDRIDREVAAKKLEIDQAKRLLGLSGDRRLDEERRQAIEDATRQITDEAARQHLEVDADRLKLIQETAAAEWDIAHARERATNAVDDISSYRQAILDRLATAREMGDTAALPALERTLRDVDAELDTAIQRAIDYWKKWETPEAKAAITGLDNLRTGIRRTREELQRDLLQQNHAQLGAQRDELRQQIDFFRNQGNVEIADRLTDQLRSVNSALLEAIDNEIKFWSESQKPEAAATLLQLQNLRNEIKATREAWSIAASDIQQSFAGALVSAISGWAEAIGQGRNALRATWDMFRSFAADFIRQLAMMLLKAAALKLAMKLGFGKVTNGLNGLLNAAPLILAGNQVKAGGEAVTEGAVALGASAAALIIGAQMLLAANAAGGGGAAAGGGASSGGAGGGLGVLSSIVGLFHSGGIAGSGTRSRSVSPAWFVNASRYHGGGIAGLRPGEVPAILERGEEILTRSNSRHILNGGRGEGTGEPKVDINNVVVFDPADVLAKAFGTRVGQRTFFTFVRQHSSVIKAALD